MEPFPLALYHGHEVLGFHYFGNREIMKMADATGIVIKVDGNFQLNFSHWLCTFGLKIQSTYIIEKL